MTTPTEYYQSLIIAQYADKPNAVAEIGAMVSGYENIYDLIIELLRELDLDNATGDRLDKIGTIVDLRRRSLPSQFTTDEEYRQFLRAKIASNTAAGYVSSNDFAIDLTDAAQFAFGSGADVIDNQDMSLTLLVPSSVPLARVQAIIDLDLLPRPQAVRYSGIIQVQPVPFAFDNNPDAGGFGDRFNPSIGGAFSVRIIT